MPLLLNETESSLVFIVFFVGKSAGFHRTGQVDDVRGVFLVDVCPDEQSRFAAEKLEAHDDVIPFGHGRTSGSVEPDLKSIRAVQVVKINSQLMLIAM